MRMAVFGWNCVCVCLWKRIVLAVDSTALMPGASKALVYPAKSLSLAFSLSLAVSKIYKKSYAFMCG